MIAEIWFTVLYQPLVNILVWLYTNVAGQNLGWAVIWLTIFLRIILIPLTMKSRKDSIKRQNVQEAAKEQAEAFKGDPIIQKEEIRKTMRQNKVSPWAKTLSLGIQLLVLVLLYQVFISGIEGRKIVTTLYDSIDYPGMLNTDFYGFNIGANHDFFWPGVVSIYIIISIFWSNRNRSWNSTKASYLILFPLFTFIVLWFLPLVKALFILTSIIFSDIIGLVISVFSPKEVEKKKS